VSGRIAILFEASGVVRDALIARGYDAVSVDLRPTERPGPHIVGDVFDHLGDGWSGAIMHYTCTYLTCSAAWAFNDPDFERYPGVGYHQRVKSETLVGAARRAAREQAIADWKRLAALPFPKAMENPAPSFLSKSVRPPDQTIQPYEFGEDASKRTGLWLDGLPLLKGTKRFPGRMVNGVERWSNQTDSGQNALSPSGDRWADRSETYPGIADAMAEQWGPYLAGQIILPVAQPGLFERAAA
jgi:hypothetical protein